MLQPFCNLQPKCVRPDGTGGDSLASVGTLWLPETDLPQAPPASGTAPAIDLIHFESWILGTCATVREVRDGFAAVQVWNAQVKRLWPDDRPMPDMVKPLVDFSFPMHLAVRDAHGGDLVVEFLNSEPVFHDNPVGVLTNSPTPTSGDDPCHAGILGEASRTFASVPGTRLVPIHKAESNFRYR